MKVITVLKYTMYLRVNTTVVPTVISIWLLVGFHPATRSVQSTPADNNRKRVWQYIEKERKKVPTKSDSGDFLFTIVQ